MGQEQSLGHDGHTVKARISPSILSINSVFLYTASLLMYKTTRSSVVKPTHYIYYHSKRGPDNVFSVCGRRLRVRKEPKKLCRAPRRWMTLRQTKQ